MTFLIESEMYDVTDVIGSVICKGGMYIADVPCFGMLRKTYLVHVGGVPEDVSADQVMRALATVAITSANCADPAIVHVWWSDLVRGSVICVDPQGASE